MIDQKEEEAASSKSSIVVVICLQAFEWILISNCFNVLLSIFLQVCF